MAVQLAEAAGVPASELAPAWLTLRQLASAALADALERGDDAVATAEALLVAETAGLSARQLAEARLVAAERSGDPDTIEEEVLLATAAPRPSSTADEDSCVSAQRADEARALARFLRDAERQALGKRLLHDPGSGKATAHLPPSTKASPEASSTCPPSTSTSSPWTRHSSPGSLHATPNLRFASSSFLAFGEETQDYDSEVFSL